MRPTSSTSVRKSPVSKTGDSQETPSRGHDPSVVGSTGVGDHPPEAGDGAASRSAIAGLVRSRHPVPTASSSVAGRVRSEVLGPFPGDLSVLALALARAGGAAVDPVAGEMAVCRRLPLAFGVGVSSRAEPCPQRCASSRPGSTYDPRGYPVLSCAARPGARATTGRPPLGARAIPQRRVLLLHAKGEAPTLHARGTAPTGSRAPEQHAVGCRARSRADSLPLPVAHATLWSKRDYSAPRSHPGRVERSSAESS